ncbi:hypothetical protein ACFLYO_05230 [Chloroflexota bacterium]
MESPVNTKPDRPTADLRFLLFWVVANTVAWAIGLISPLIVGIALFNAFSIEVATGESGGMTSLLGFAASIIVGITTLPIAISVGQWLVLRRHIVKAIWWIPASVVGFIGGLIAIFFLSGNLIGWVVLGAMSAIPQWLILRRQLAGAGWWIPTGIIQVFIWRMPVVSTTDLVVADLVVPGVAGALVTGSVLLLLLRRRARRQIVQSSSEN